MCCFCDTDRTFGNGNAKIVGVKKQNKKQKTFDRLYVLEVMYAARLAVDDFNHTVTR